MLNIAQKISLFSGPGDEREQGKEGEQRKGRESADGEKPEGELRLPEDGGPGVGSCLGLIREYPCDPWLRIPGGENENENEERERVCRTRKSRSV